MSFVFDILETAKTDPKARIITEVHEDRNLSYANETLIKNVACIQKSLQEMNIHAQSKVCLLGPNGFHWIALDLAIVSLGAVTVPLYHRQDSNELSGIIDNVTPDMVIYFDENLMDELSQIKPITCMKIHANDFFVQDASSPELTKTDIVPNQTATIIYTSGTSGQPKGVMLSHENIDFMLTQTKRNLKQSKFGSDKKDIVFHYLPLCFAGSRLMMWTQLHRGNEVHLSMDLKNLANEMAAVNPNYFLNVPALLERIKNGVEEKISTSSGAWVQKQYANAKINFQKISLKKASIGERLQFWFSRKIILSKIKNKIGRNLDFLVCGSAPLHPDTQIWFLMLGIPIYQVYGLTETTAIVTMDTPEISKEGYVGTPIESIEYKISDNGELLTKGPHIFQGYYNRQDLTDQAVKNGWFHTGDLVEFDDQKRLKVKGRTKNVIIPSSGHNIMPEPLEESICAMDTSVEHACIVGHGKPKVGVILAGKMDKQKIESLIENFNQMQPHYKKMAFYIHADEGFTVENGLLTANQKLKRGVIEEHFDTQIQQQMKEAV